MSTTFRIVEGRLFVPLALVLLQASVISDLCAQEGTHNAHFEAVSVKRSDPSQSSGGALSGKLLGGPGTADPARLRGSGVTLLTIIRAAYDLAPDQVSGPGWIQDQTYTLTATLPASSSRADLMAMLENVLAERFHLTFHRGQKQIEGYTLHIAPSGSKLKPTAYPDAQPIRPGAFAPASDVDRDGYPVIPAGKSGATGINRNGAMCWTYQSVPITVLISNLQAELGTTMTLNSWSPERVLDETGLRGKYDFKLLYASNGQIGSGLRPDSASVAEIPEGGIGASDPGSGPSLFQALEKELGLRLVRQKLPVDMFFIDHVDQTPTEN